MKEKKEPWRVPDRSPAPGRYRMGPEFPGCINTGTRPIVYRLPRGLESRTGQAFVVCHECDHTAVQSAVTLGQAVGKRHLPKRKGWHGNAWVFKTRAAAVAKFEEWCERLQGEYDAMRERAAQLRRTVADRPGTADAAAAALELSDLGI